MRFRLGFVSGFASGYFLGARAGRQRYEQIKDALAKARRSQTVETAADRARDAIDRRPTPPDDGSPNGTATVPTASTVSDSPAASYAPYAVDSPTDDG
jgi:hypothetical protein